MNLFKSKALLIGIIGAVATFALFFLSIAVSQGRHDKFAALFGISILLLFLSVINSSIGTIFGIIELLKINQKLQAIFGLIINVLMILFYVFILFPIITYIE